MPEAKSPGQNWLKNPFLPAAAIILLGLLVYAGTFNAAFHFDDMYHLVENPALQGFRRLPELLRYWPTRALAFFTFALNRQLHGLWLPGYHLVNLLLHLAAALLVRQLALLALAAPRLAGTPAARHRAAVGLFAGLIFVSHPVQTQAVTYIYQRSTLLAAALYLLALVLYLRWRLDPAGRRAGACYLGALAAGLLAMFSKEIAFTLPLALLLAELCFFEAGWRRLPWRRLAPFLALLVVVPLTLWLGRPPTVEDIDRLTSGATPLAWRHYLYTQARVLLTYLRLLVLPVRQVLDYDYPVVRRALAPAALSGWSALLLMLLAAGGLFRRERLPAFAILFFLLALSVESSFIPLQDVIFEHRLYLPMAGFALLLPALFFRLAGKRPAGLRTAAGFLLLVCLVFGGLAFARNRVWRTELSLWSDNVARAPNKARPRVFLGLAYKHLNQLDRALEQLELAIKLEPRNYYAYCNRGLVYHQLGRHDLALADLSRALEKNPKDPPTLAWRGMVYLDQGALDSALADLDRAAALAPHYAETYFHRGRVRIRKREFEPAIQDFNRMLAHDPGSAITYNQRAIALAGAGQTGAAIADWQEALRRQPDFGEAGFNLALIYYLNRDYQNAWEAVRYLEKIGFPVPGEFLEALRKESE